MKIARFIGSRALPAFLAAVWFLPFLAVVYGAAVASEPDAPSPYQFDPGFIRTIIVSVFVCGAAAVLSVTFGTMAGYAISQKRFYGKNLLFGCLVGVMFFPPVVFIAPLFKVCASLRIYDTLLALILPSAATAFSIVYMKETIDRVPSAILDAARIDGVGEVRILTRIVAPQVRGPLTALAVLQFLATWGALAVPLAVVDSPRNYTLTLRLASAIQELNHVPARELLWSIGLITIPAIVLFVLRARQIVRGVMNILFRYQEAGGNAPS